MTRTVATFGLAAAALVAFSGHAFAHAHLKVATPADKSTLKVSPSQLDLSFSEPLNLKFSGVKVTGPDKTTVKTGEAMLMDKGATLMVPVPTALPPGNYTIEWHALSADGHKTSGNLTFTVQP